MNYDNINFSPHFLEGEKIYLRPLTFNDVSGEYPYWLNDQHICANNSHAVYPYTLANAYDFIKNIGNRSDLLVLAIIEKKTQTHIGNISLQSINPINRSCELAILIGNSQFWGHGYGTEAAKLLVKHAIKNLNLRRIYFGTPESNQGMKKIGENLGMRQEGCRKEAFFKNGKYEDILEYGIVVNND